MLATGLISITQVHVSMESKASVTIDSAHLGGFDDFRLV